jgi:hypothetical protein
VTPETCPTCGAAVSRGAKACLQCGADETTGWADSARSATAADLGLPDEDFDYEEFARREFGPGSPKPLGLNWVWWLTGIAVLAAILLAWLL